MLKGPLHVRTRGTQGSSFAELLGLSSTNSLEKVMHKNPVASPLQMSYEWRILQKIGKEE